MRHRTPHTPHSALRTPHSRRAFTLVELLVTIGIILILITLLAATFGGLFGTARSKATRATIEKINALVNDRMEAINRSIDGGELRSKVVTIKAQGNTEELARIFVRKEAMKAAFPQTWAEAGAAASSYASGNSLNPATESSEVLFWVLTQGTLYGTAPVGQDSFVANELRDTDNDGLLEFVDAWERPLRFYRWPTRLVRPEGAGTPVNRPLVEMLIEGTTTDMLGSDPDDPKRLFTSSSFEADYHTRGTYHTPLVVSAGEDGDLGLREPADFSTTDDHSADTGFGYLAHPSSAVATAVVDGGGDPGDTALADNITNRRALGNE